MTMAGKRTTTIAPLGAWAARWRSDDRAVMVGDRMARFKDPLLGERAMRPFPAYVREPVAVGVLEAGWVLRPFFGMVGRDAVIDLAVEVGTHFYGTGEQAGSLIRNGTRKHCWNYDRYGYDDASLSLYQSHPYVLGVRRDGSAFGVICETTRRCEIDLTAGGRVRFRVFGCGVSESPGVLVIEREHPAEVVKALAELTGKMPLPPRWALGYQQCRWSYESEEKAREIARGFRERKLPCDVIWFDIDYMHKFECFTFDERAFPDPKQLNADLHAMGFKTVWMIDPGLHVDAGYGVYEAGRAGGHYVTTREGEEYHGTVWPGACAFPDFTNERTRAWWANHYQEFMSKGIDGVWNDMNEPAVFHAEDKTMPTDNQHRADAELGGPGEHAVYHNIYGMQMVRATREGIQRANPTKRPFVLTRANFLGGQRYAATWTGDNTSDWRHLRWSIPMALNLGLSGQPFVGPDIGGFIGNADGEMMARWMGIGAMLPFARGHSIKESVAHEPWAFGERCEAACRAALERRYRLLPYLYTVFREASRTGMPIVRPLWFADVRDARLRGVENAFLVGGDVLVRAELHSERAVDRAMDTQAAPVPAGWHRIDHLVDGARSHEVAAALLPELYVREGAIVALGPVMEFVGQRALDPLTLIVALDAKGEAEGAMYEDAGDGYEHERGGYRLTTYRARHDGQEVRMEERVEGRLEKVARAVEVVVVNTEAKPKGGRVAVYAGAW